MQDKIFGILCFANGNGEERLDTTAAFCYRAESEKGELNIRSNKRDVDPPSVYSLP